jgi:hypothetical protein
VNTIGIDHVRSDKPAEFEQVMPVAPISREPGRFKAEDSADSAFADTAHEISKSGSIHGAAGGATEIFIDDRYLAKAVALCELNKGVLPPLTLQIFLHLQSCRLTHVYDSVALGHLFGQFTKRHGAPRFLCLRLRLEGAGG